MTAAYYVSEFSGPMLKPHEQTLRDILPSVNGCGGQIGLALGKTGSAAGKRLSLSSFATDHDSTHTYSAKH